MLKVNDSGSAIIGDPPESLVQSNSYSPQQTARQKQWYADYAKFLGATPDQIWKNKLYSLSAKEQFALADSVLKDFDGDVDRSVGLVNWLGGGGIYKGFWGDRSCWSDQNDYLDVDNIVTEGTIRPYKISDLLVQLRSVNPAAHTYFAQKAYAKALKLNQTLDSGYGMLNNPTVNKTAESAQKLVDSAAKIPKTVIDLTRDSVDMAVTTVEGVSFFARNAYWIVPTTVVGVGYLAYRNRELIVGSIPQTAALKALANRK
jgi:hypothetical protein